MNRFEAQIIHEKLRGLFAGFGRVALLTPDMQTVYLQYQFLTDLGTLPQSAEVAHRYLQLQDGDIVLTNDPYSGGTLLSSPTLVMGIGTRQQKGSCPAEFLVAVRVALQPQMGQYKTIDEEGLRVPPSPYYIRGELNAPIVEALRAHPLTPKDFTHVIDQEARKLFALRETFKTALTDGSLDLSRNVVKAYLQLTQNEFLRRLDELGEGSTSVNIDISLDETIKLKVEYFDGHFTFDFNGTSMGRTMFLTDSATIGACVGATISLLCTDIPINSGIFERFDVKAPRGCLVNSAFPRPVFLGHTDGPGVIANLVTKAFSQIHKKQAWATSGPTHCFYQLKFSANKVFLDALPVGSGARETRPGMHGVFIWWRISRYYSIEELEKQFPIQILNMGFRPNSSGEGLVPGGHGVVRTVKLLDDAELAWSHVEPLHKPEGLYGGKSALGPEMILQKAGGEKIELKPSGVMKVGKGDVLTVMSPGGGGFGQKVATAAAASS